MVFKIYLGLATVPLLSISSVWLFGVVMVACVLLHLLSLWVTKGDILKCVDFSVHWACGLLLIAVLPTPMHSLLLYFLVLLPLTYGKTYGDILDNQLPMPWLLKTLGPTFNTIMVPQLNRILAFLPDFVKEQLVFGEFANHRVSQQLANPPESQGYAFFGDSEFTYWYNLAEDMQPFAPGCFNAGFGGSRIPDLITWMDRFCLRWQPKVVVLHCMGNDWDTRWKVWGRPSSETLAVEAHANALQLVRLLHESSHVRQVVWLLTPRKPTYTDAKWEYFGMFAEKLQGICNDLPDKTAGSKFFQVCDLRHLEVDSGTDLMLDMCHLNAVGHKKKSVHLIQWMRKHVGTS
eukprot:TRINITY_DN30892_c0_g1_i1.p1 TRINITY_DN30892_c0_g1~~TRINITY_DN30892_c0_g1_i1.p1  ORF type:complete len:347 (+),score=48.62 TRINITY_DN30892_c0_g1_i1:72-1112(+)